MQSIGKNCVQWESCDFPSISSHQFSNRGISDNATRGGKQVEIHVMPRVKNDSLSEFQIGIVLISTLNFTHVGINTFSHGYLVHGGIR